MQHTEMHLAITIIKASAVNAAIYLARMQAFFGFTLAGFKRHNVDEPPRQGPRSVWKSFCSGSSS